MVYPSLLDSFVDLAKADLAVTLFLIGLSLSLATLRNGGWPLRDGEDFELLFAVDQEKFSIALDLGFHHIGALTANVAIIELTRDGETTILEPKGYRHF